VVFAWKELPCKSATAALLPLDRNLAAPCFGDALIILPSVPGVVPPLSRVFHAHWALLHRSFLLGRILLRHH
jgi:hypothetical protein